MNTLTQQPPISARPSTVTSAPPSIIPSYSRRAILAVWAAATVPMGLLAWVGAPLLAHAFSGEAALSRALILCLAGGLVWQFVLVISLVAREQRSLRPSTLRRALWLTAPRSPKTGRTTKRAWLLLLPLIALFGAEELIPAFPHASARDLGLFLDSDAGRHLLHGSWGWGAAILVMLVFNTVLGEELLFRGFLLPRMGAAFGRADWAVNGLLFAAYHVHVPWVMPAALVDSFLLAYPSRRYRSAWFGIAVHSAQSVIFGALVLSLVL